MSLVSVLLGFLGQFCLQKLSDHLRYSVMMSDDDEVDEYEEKWNGASMEAETDVMALTTSWQLVQTLQFLITGRLPNKEGKEAWVLLVHHSSSQVLAMLASSLFFVVAMTIVIFNTKAIDKLTAQVSRNEASLKWLLRVKETILAVISMGFAWSVFVSGEWFIASLPLIRTTEDDMLLQVSLAMFFSMTCFTCIRGLDMIADWHLGMEVDHTIVQIISAVGILIGFSWEQCFDVALDSLSRVFPSRQIAKMGLAVFCAGILVPAWRWWILPMVLKEGWRFGFIIEPEHHERWLEVLKDERFVALVDKVRVMHSSVDDAHNLRTTAKRRRRQPDNFMSNTPLISRPPMALGRSTTKLSIESTHSLVHMLLPGGRMPPPGDDDGRLILGPDHFSRNTSGQSEALSTIEDGQQGKIADTFGCPRSALRKQIEALEAQNRELQAKNRDLESKQVQLFASYEGCLVQVGESVSRMHMLTPRLRG